MQKNENPVVLAVILCTITAVVAFLLASVNNGTKDRIAMLAEKEQIEARAAVLSSATGFLEHLYNPAEESPVTKVYTGISGETIVGYCVQVAPAGYGGPIEMVVGVTNDLTVEAVKIVSLSETPGLGSKSQDEKFIGQYFGKNGETSFSVIKAGEPEESEIIAISGATITSKAVTEGVNAALSAVKEIKGVQ